MSISIELHVGNGGGGGDCNLFDIALLNSYVFNLKAFGRRAFIVSEEISFVIL